MNSLLKERSRQGHSGKIRVRTERMEEGEERVSMKRQERRKERRKNGLG